MADFSKQYCEIHDPEMPFDFDILEEAKHIPPGHYISMICEGFGFIAISKDKNNEILLAIPTEDGEYFHWKEYNDVIK
jgi:hypothetical protein